MKLSKLISLLKFYILPILSLANSSKIYSCFRYVSGSFLLLDLTSYFSCSASAFICSSLWSLIVFICSSALPRGKYANIACSIILL